MDTNFMKGIVSRFRGWVKGGRVNLPASNRQERTAMDVVKYLNGREMRLGDEVVFRTSDGKAWAGTVVNSEPKWGTLGLVPSGTSLVYATPGNCLHVEDAFKPRTVDTTPVGTTGQVKEQIATAKGSDGGGPPPPPKESDPAPAPVKTGPKPGEEGGPAIVAPE